MNKGLLYGVIAGGIVIVLGVIAFFVVFATQTVTERQAAIPDLLAADTVVYGTITPNLADLPNAQRLLSAYPQLAVQEDPSTADEPLNEELGVNFEQDIAPWLGTEVSFAIGGLGDISTIEGSFDDPAFSDELSQRLQITMIAASTNNESAQAFLDKQRTNREAEGEQFASNVHQEVTIYEQTNVEDPTYPLKAFALVGDVVVFSNQSTAIQGMIDRQAGGGDSLASNPRFTRLRETMPDGIGYIFLDGQVFSDFFQTALDEATMELPTEQAELLAQQMGNLEALQAMGFSIALAGEGVKFDATINFDLGAFNEEGRALVEEARQPVDAARLAQISDEALALITFRLPESFGPGIIEAINAQEGGPEGLADFEAQTGISLEQDILSWMVGEVSLVLLPTEMIAGSTLPATYLSITSANLGSASTGLDKLATLAGMQGGLPFVAEQVDGIDWQVVQDPFSGQTAGGYAVTDSDVVIALGTTAMSAYATGSEAPITASNNFSAVISSLPDPNGGIFYVDVANIMDTLNTLGATQDIEPEAQEVIDPLTSIGAANTPGINEDGVSISTMFFRIRGEGQ
ncbi:MAG: DUF3352 domain-containing protein [Chloroflexaceae bacterium]|nr:DUF3352 domain-containing protein [Chloroflexaceae bacterium]